LLLIEVFLLGKPLLEIGTGVGTATVGVGAKESFFSVNWLFSQFASEGEEVREKSAIRSGRMKESGSPWQRLKGQLIVGTDILSKGCTG
jgi:hypothetical protein